MFVELINSDIDAVALHNDLSKLLADHDLYYQNQISITSVMGDDDWTCSIGRNNLKFKERYYSTINKSLENTYMHSIIERYPQYYRWRVLKLLPKTTYSVHDDFNGVDDNLRLHVPITTNQDSFLCFFAGMPSSGSEVKVAYEHLELGKSYEVNTTGLHTAVNYGTTDRYHLVGIRYENRDHRTH
jgi:hypothetical protein